MLSFLLMFRYFTRIIRHASKDPTFRALALVTAALLALGSTFYHLFEGWRWLDSLYFSVITLATIGYGDFAPKTDLGKVFTMIYALMGIGLLVALFSRIAEASIGIQRERLEKKNSRPEE